MFKFISKLILVFTVLSALVGQAMAVDTMSFEMDIDNKHYNSNSESPCVRIVVASVFHKNITGSGKLDISEALS